MNNNKITNSKWILLKNPMLYAAFAFTLSIITSGAFNLAIYIILKLGQFINASFCLVVAQLGKIPTSFFDGILYLLTVFYTFHFKEKMTSYQIIKISICFMSLVLIRAIIQWNFIGHDQQPFYKVLEILFSALGLIVTFLITCIGMKITNILSLKWLEIHKKEN